MSLKFAVDSMEALRRPLTGGEQGLAAVTWIGLSLLGLAAQRRVSARALGRDRVAT